MLRVASLSPSSSSSLRFLSNTKRSRAIATTAARLFSDNGSNNNKKSLSTSTVILPTKSGVGEEAPRFPHLLALPLVSRPIFPGLVTSVTLTDPETIHAMEALMDKASSSSGDASSTAAYITTFLRKKHSTGVDTDGGIILTTPEVIHSASDLYETGTFVQIQRLTRNLGSMSSTSSSTSSSRSTQKQKAAAASAARLEEDEEEEDEEMEEEDTKGKTSSSSSDGAATLILLAHRRVDLVSVDNIGPPIDVTVSHWPRMEYTGKAGGGNSNNDDTLRALSNEIISTIREVAQLSPLFRENLQFFPMRVDANDPYRLADFAASISASGTPEDLQAVLSERNAEVRLHKALVLLNREREVSKLQKEISEKVEEKMSEAQRKYFLHEQLKSIKKELGMEKDDKDAVMEKYRAQLATYAEGAIPQQVMDTIQAELDKFSTLEKNSPEFSVTRSYLDWLIGVPWGVVTPENFDITKARQVLDRDHYGLDDVKDTILQFIAVGKLVGSIQGKILCLAGPPGTGKTSIARSVADSLGRKFFRFSVGGLSDVSEIKGHRRTYIGALPGKIIQCLKTTGTSNPVVLVDEIDKLGMGYRGDPASALLEVLDPSQNSSYVDHYLDVPVDISKVLFICTANELERIPGPLLDRMEVIRLSGYDFPEKLAIAEQYLVPKSMLENGLYVEKKKKKSEKEKKTDTTASLLDTPEEKDDTSAADEADDSVDKDVVAKTPLDKCIHAKGVPPSLTLTTDAIRNLIRWYAREAGVRSLAKYIDKITRKLALQIVAEDEGAELTKKSARKSDTWQVTEENLVDYVGKPIFTSDRLYEEGPLPPGIIMGLAYTSMGGSALYIETQGIKRGRDGEGKKRGGGTLKATGQLGDVMQESTQIAYTVARAILAQVEPDNDYFDTMDIHMHVPEGATPKDGPSAGITMVTSMLSLAMGRPIRNDLAMTGECSLTGKVMAVGGIKEKIMAARRSGIQVVILPQACRRDFDEIPDYLKEGLEVHYADHYDKVYEIAFPKDSAESKSQAQREAH